MKYIHYFFFIFILISASCNKDETDNTEDICICGVDNALEDLEWLKNLKNSITNCSCQVSILEGIYNENMVYYVLMNDPLCNSYFNTALINCNGEVVKTYEGSEDLDAFANEVEPIRSIYICSDK